MAWWEDGYGPVPACCWLPIAWCGDILVCQQADNVTQHGVACSLQSLQPLSATQTAAAGKLFRASVHTCKLSRSPKRFPQGAMGASG